MNPITPAAFHEATAAIPRYNPRDPLHRQIVAAAKRCPELSAPELKRHVEVVIGREVGQELWNVICWEALGMAV